MSRQVNVGDVPKEVADGLDENFHKFCAKLREHGLDILPKKALWSYALTIWIKENLGQFLETSWEDAEQKAVEKIIENARKFWKEHGGELKTDV